MVGSYRILWSLVVGLALGLVVAFGAQAKLVNVAVLHTNDTCGRLESFYHQSTRPLGGLAKRAIFFQEKRQHKKLHWLALDAGNIFGFTRMSYYFEGFIDVHLCNWLGYDAAGIGPMEFIFGREVLETRLREADFPFICSNVLDSSTGKYLGEPFKVFTFDGFRIALIGLADPRIPDLCSAPFTEGLTFRDPEQVVSEWIPQFRGQADAIFLVSTLPFEENVALADRHPEIAVIISGGQGAALQVPLKVGPTLIVQAGKWGMDVGVLKMTFEGDSATGYHVRYFDEELVPMDGKWVENTKFLAELSTYHERLEEKLGVVLGKLTADMPATKVNSYETKLGDFFADAVRSATGADVALLDAGSFRDGLLAGAVTEGDLYRAYPSDAQVVTGVVDGDALGRILSQGAGMVGRGGFLQVSGVTFGLYGANAYDVKVQGEELDPLRRYGVAVTDRMLEGFGGLTSMCLIQDAKPTGIPVRKVVGGFLEEKREFTNEVEGRMTYYAEPPPEEVFAPSEEEAPPLELPTEETAPVEEGVGAEELPEEVPELVEEEGVEALPTEGKVAEPGALEELAPQEETGALPGAEPPGEFEVIAEEEVDTGLAPPKIATEEEMPPAPGEAPEATPEGEPALIGETSQVVEGVEYILRIERNELEGEPFFVMSLILRNDGDSFKLFDFPSGQHYDFRVFKDKNRVWEWSYNRYFVQTRSSLRLDPGDSQTFTVHWDGATNRKVPLERGLYRFCGLVTAVPEREISFVALFEPPLI